MRYAINENGYVTFKTGETPFPQGSAWPIGEYESYPTDHLKIINGQLLVKTDDELRIEYLPARYRTDGGLDQYGNQVWIEKSEVDKDLADSDGQAEAVAKEIARQEAKPLKLKVVENKFLSICDQLTGSNTHAKLGFDELNAIAGQIQDANTKVGVAIQLLAIYAEAKREGGLKWWDDCAWHQI